MIYTEQYKAYDYEYDFIGGNILYRQMIHKMVDTIPIEELKKIYPLEEWNDAEPKGKPGPILYTMLIRIEI